MSRQPFLPVHKNKPTAVGIGVMSPKLASLIGECAEAWTYVDLHLALTMGSLLGVENKASVAVFSSLRNSRAQRDALQAAANATLSDDLREMFTAILNLHRELDSQRNDIVHGIWGRSDLIEDGAIWTSLQHHAVMLITDYHALQPGKPPLEGYDRTENMTKNYFVWKYKDIASTIAEIKALAEAIAHFHGHLRYPHHSAGAYALRELHASPLIKKEIRRMRTLKPNTGELGSE